MSCICKFMSVNKNIKKNNKPMLSSKRLQRLYGFRKIAIINVITVIIDGKVLIYRFNKYFIEGSEG